MQAARRITRQKSSTQTLSHDQSWRSSRLKRIDFNEKNHIAIIDISDLDALGIFLGQFESPSVIAGKKIESDSGTARQWQHITKAQLLDWIATEEVKMDFKNIDDVRRVADPRSNVKTLYAVAAKSVWEEGRVSLPRLKPFLREKWFSHMALERTDVSAPSTNVVPLFESLLLDLSNVDLRAMSFLTPQNITDLARTCGGTWTSLNLSGHERLQTEDIISIIRQTPKLRLLSLGSNDSLDLDLAEILQVAGNRCRIEHRGLYQTYFNEGTCEAHFAKPLIGQIVVAETDDSVVRFLIAPAADEHLFFLQCGRGLKRLRREFTRKHPASHIHALAMIENGFALEENDAVRPMPRLVRKWTQEELCLDFPPRYSLDTWTLLVRYRKGDAPTFEFTFAKLKKTRKRKNSEIDSKTSNIVVGGLDTVAKAEGLDSIIQGTDLDAPATWTDRWAKDTFISVVKEIGI